MNVLEPFNDCLSELLSINNVKPAELADAIEIDVSLIYKYLRKKCVPSFANIVSIADYFNCSLDFMFGFNSETLQPDLRVRRRFRSGSNKF